MTAFSAFTEEIGAQSNVFSEEASVVTEMMTI